jgi:hypothetical protein
MKMFLKNLGIAAFVVSLTSCGGAEGTKIETTGEKVADASTEQSGHKDLSFKLNDVIKLGDYVVTVTRVIDNAPASDEFSTPDAGKKFVAVEVLYENRTSDKTLDYNPFDWKLIDSDSYNYEMDGNTSKEPTLQAGTINPGQKARGWINFQTPKDAKQFKLQFQPSWLSNENVEIQLY